MDARRVKIVRTAWVALPAIVLTFADTALTLLFQPSSYWAGDLFSAHEYSPWGAGLLHVHPAAFAAFMLAWACVIVVIAGMLREPWNRVWALMIVIGHSAGAFDWLEDLDYTAALFTFLGAALLTVFCWGKAAALRSPGDAPEPRP